MKELLSAVTRKGQVTVPAEVRRTLGLKEGDKVAFVMDEDQVRLVPVGSVVDRTAGMFRTGRRPETAAELRDAAERAVAGQAVERMAS